MAQLRRNRGAEMPLNQFKLGVNTKRRVKRLLSYFVTECAMSALSVLSVEQRKPYNPW